MGRSRHYGSLAAMCNFFDISKRSDCWNCCLFVHLIVALLNAGIVSFAKLLYSHDQLLYKYLFNNVERVDIDVVSDVLDSLKIQKDVFVRFIIRNKSGCFYYAHYVGDPASKPIYITWVRNHFFIARHLF